jgi:hypothetical protein
LQNEWRQKKAFTVTTLSNNCRTPQSLKGAGRQVVKYLLKATANLLFSLRLQNVPGGRAYLHISAHSLKRT